ncbi:hypothetical protein D9619_003980 [Psilocybe cf. subviscida]|uniref:DUF7918 domain-containing protein n=1 Tax=Psilocybe cf. subviscida TaxID=2480587 RepID=A0A8H5BQL3_9AGAR|nr:hypothetical protein D9619_003980 [Psilocybe cf. subviscida]
MVSIAISKFLTELKCKDSAESGTWCEAPLCEAILLVGSEAFETAAAVGATRMPRKPTRNSLELKNFHAWIEVDGNKLDCYAIDIPNKRVREASCWIASEENKTFSVKLDKTQLMKSHYRVSLSLDGTQTDARLIRKTANYTAIFSGLHTDDSFRHFKFAPLNVTDEEEYRDTVMLRPEAPKIGEITLRVHRVTGLKTTKHKKGEKPKSGGEELNEENSDEESVPQPQKVHESSVKATLVPHQVSLGDPIPNNRETLPSGGVVENAPKTKAKTEYYTQLWYTKMECLATFTFRYRPIEGRSEDVLVDGGIVPRRMLNPEAESSEEEDEDDDMDTDEREFRGSPPTTFNTTEPPRASTRFASVGPNGNGKRVNYADPGSTEDGDDSDIYVRTDEERAMREAQAQAQAQSGSQGSIQPEGQAPTVATIAPVSESTPPESRPESEPSASAAQSLILGQSDMNKNPAETLVPTQTVQLPTTQPPGVDNQRQPSPVIRQESEEPSLNLGSATVGTDGQPNDLNPSEAIAKEENRDIKLEEIERKVSPLSEDDEEEEEERELRLKLEAIKARKRKNKEFQRTEAAKRVKAEPENRFYFKPGEVVDLVSS